MPKEKFSIIYADPPWRYEQKNRQGSAELHYPTMSMQDCGFSSKDIQRVLTQLYEVFDFYTLEQAKQKYNSGNY